MVGRSLLAGCLVVCSLSLVLALGPPEMLWDAVTYQPPLTPDGGDNGRVSVQLTANPPTFGYQFSNARTDGKTYNVTISTSNYPHVAAGTKTPIEWAKGDLLPFNIQLNGDGGGEPISGSVGVTPDITQIIEMNNAGISPRAEWPYYRCEFGSRHNTTLPTVFSDWERPDPDHTLLLHCHVTTLNTLPSFQMQVNSIQRAIDSHGTQTTSLIDVHGGHKTFDIANFYSSLSVANMTEMKLGDLIVFNGRFSPDAEFQCAYRKFYGTGERVWQLEPVLVRPRLTPPLASHELACPCAPHPHDLVTGDLFEVNAMDQQGHNLLRYWPDGRSPQGPIILKFKNTEPVPPPPSPPSDGPSAGVVVGAVFGVLLFLVLAVALPFYYRRKQRNAEMVKSPSVSSDRATSPSGYQAV